jgi:hypothetical protein
MAIAGSGKGIQIVVGAEYNGKDLKRAQRDLDSMKRAAGQTQGPIAGLATKMRSMLGPALIAAGAAAGAFAVKLGVDGVRGAIEDQKAVEVLAQTLESLGLAHENAGVERFEQQMVDATGTGEDLRAALGRLAIATGDTGDAMALTSAAMDVSVATGKEFKTVYEGMARAIATGTAGRLAAYGITVDQTTVKTEGMTAALLDATAVFGGAAANEAKTLEGRLRILGNEVYELQEAFGYGFLEGLGMDEVGEDAGDLAEALRAMRPAADAAGQSVGEFVALLGELAGGLGAVGKAAEGNDGLRTFLEVVEATVATSPAEWFSTVTGWFGNTEEAAYDAAEAHEDYRDAAVRGAEGSREAAEALAEVEEEARAAAVELSGLNAVLGDLRTLADAEAAWDDLKQQIKDTGSALGNQTAKQRETTEAAWRFIEATGEAAMQQWELDRSTGIAEAGLRDLTKQFDFTKMSPATAAQLLQPFQALIDDLRIAGYDVSTLQAQIDRLQSKTITITIITERRERGGLPGTPGAPGGDNEEWYGAATGGPVRGPGTTRSDSIPAMLSNGEYVIQASAVKALGLTALGTINRGALPMTGGRSGGGLTVQNLVVNSVAGERAEDSVPRALRRLAFVAGL